MLFFLYRNTSSWFFYPPSERGFCRFFILHLNKMKSLKTFWGNCQCVKNGLSISIQWMGKLLIMKYKQLYLNFGWTLWQQNPRAGDLFEIMLFLSWCGFFLHGHTASSYCTPESLNDELVKAQMWTDASVCQQSHDRLEIRHLKKSLKLNLEKM